MKHSNY